jgi:flagellar hook-associated protein 1 FlgK
MSFGGLYISVSGIYANKKSLDTVSHNIANVNNPNYVRQGVTHAERRYSTTGNLKYQTGAGVNVQEIRQIRDEFLDIKLRREMATFGYHYAKAEILGEVEGIFDDGFQEMMNEFWKGWDELFKEPTLTSRELLHENAVAFTTTVNHMSIQIDNLQYILNKEMINKAEEVNNILGDIANLNNKIKLAESYGQNISANDYRDDRNAAMDKLAQLIPITHYENKYGEEVVSLQGRDLINGNYFNPIEVRLNDKGHGEIYWSDTGEPIDLKGLGELGGYIDARDKSVVKYRDKLDTMVGTLADKINEIHKDGVGLDGTTGLNFFEFEENNPSATIKVNKDLADFNKIAAGKTNAKNDGDNAKEILDLREEFLFENGTMKIDGFYRDLILTLGLERQESRDIAENQVMLIRQIDERRSEISSVSLDEEMADMLRYQHSYIANSRVINAIDEMIDQVVNRMGIAGR